MSIFFEVNVRWAGKNVRMLQRGYRLGVALVCKVLVSHISIKEKFREALILPYPPSVFFLNTTPATCKEHKNILCLPGLAPNFADMYASFVGTV